MSASRLNGEFLNFGPESVSSHVLFDGPPDNNQYRKTLAKSQLRYFPLIRFPDQVLMGFVIVIIIAAGCMFVGSVNVLEP